MALEIEQVLGFTLIAIAASASASMLLYALTYISAAEQAAAAAEELYNARIAVAAVEKEGRIIVGLRNDSPDPIHVRGIYASSTTCPRLYVGGGFTLQPHELKIINASIWPCRGFTSVVAEHSYGISVARVLGRRSLPASSASIYDIGYSTYSIKLPRGDAESGFHAVFFASMVVNVESEGYGVYWSNSYYAEVPASELLSSGRGIVSKPLRDASGRGIGGAKLVVFASDRYGPYRFGSTFYAAGVKFWLLSWPWYDKLEVSICVGVAYRSIAPAAAEIEIAPKDIEYRSRNAVVRWVTSLTDALDPRQAAAQLSSAVGRLKIDKGGVFSIVDATCIYAVDDRGWKTIWTRDLADSRDIDSYYIYADGSIPSAYARAIVIASPRWLPIPGANVATYPQASIYPDVERELLLESLR